jgi:hypothetical protein
MTATLCADGILPPESWDEDAPDMDRLLAVCRCCICPSMAACAAAGAADPLATGVWGARFFRSAPETKRQGRAGRQKLDDWVAAERLCGTESGAKRHYRAGERPCNACQVAETAAKARRGRPSRARVA